MITQMVVKEIKPDGNRVKLYSDDPTFYVIGNYDRVQGVVVGDTIEYETIGQNYGHFIKKVEIDAK
jgi:hypothetical protein